MGNRLSKHQHYAMFSRVPRDGGAIRPNEKGLTIPVPSPEDWDATLTRIARSVHEPHRKHR